MTTFTAEQAAKRWRCSPEMVEEFLSDFTAAGFVIEHTSSEGTTKFVRKDTSVKSTRTWSVTPAGLAIAYVLSHADDRESA